jgi:hypothetical protein
MARHSKPIARRTAAEWDAIAAAAAGLAEDDTVATLTCAFGTPWLDHFGPPIGNARGCRRCEAGIAGARRRRRGAARRTR